MRPNSQIVRCMIRCSLLFVTCSFSFGCGESKKDKSPSFVVTKSTNPQALDQSEAPDHIKSNPRGKMILEGSEEHAKRMQKLQKEAAKTGKPPAKPY